MRAASFVSRVTLLTLRRSPRSLRSMSAPATAKYASVDVRAANALRAQGVKFLDVRTPEEFAQGHAPGAVNVPVMLSGPGGMQANPAFLEALTAALPDAQQPMLVCCKAGGRSAKAAGMLSEAGYVQLTDVQGGMTAWTAAALPEEK